MAFKPIDATILTQETNQLAFKLISFEDLHSYSCLIRYNYYAIILIQKGSIGLTIDLGNYELNASTIICLSPYQPFSMRSGEKVLGYMLNFHPDFFCTYRHQNEIETEGILFNNFSSVPFFSVKNTSRFVDGLLKMNTEIHENQIGTHEVLVSLLKIFLINLIRERQGMEGNAYTSKIKEKPVLLQSLVDAIENNFRKLHAPRDYANILHITPQQLNKIVKNSCDITVSQMISNRILVEAKRELYLTSKTIKEIANVLGYNDEFYFSRFFKKHVGISPKLYRQTVGFAKME